MSDVENHRKSSTRRESMRVTNPLAPNKDGALDIEQPGIKKSKWKVVKNKYEDYKEAKREHLEVTPQRLLSRLREDLLDENGKPNPKKMLLLKALKKKEESTYDGFLDQLTNELFIWMSELFAMLSPGKTGHYYRILTYLLTIVCCTLYIFMMGEYTASEDATEKFRNGTSAERLMWLVTDRGGSALAFDTDFLIHWGARYMPRIQDGDHWRWFTGILLHSGAGHLFTNMVMFFILSHHLENKYGWWRVGFVVVLSGIGGSFVSAAMEKACNIYVGFSGVCFGLMGLFIADILLNFETVEKPKTKIVLSMFFFILMVAQMVLEGETSHVSHAAGLIIGLLPSFTFLPNFTSEKWEVALPPLGFLTVAIVCLIFPPYVYQKRLDDITCT